MILRTLPGLTWIRERPDVLLVCLPNGDLHLRGIEIAATAEKLLDQLHASPSARGDVIATVAASLSVSEALVEYVTELLLGARCMRALPFDANPSELEWLHWARTGLDDASSRWRRPVTCIAYKRDASTIQSAVQNADCIPTLKLIEPNMMASDIARTYLRDDTSAALSLCFGPPIGHPFTRSLGRHATTLSRPVLFGDASGFVGRIGPTVLGRNAPCLECVRTRHAANGGSAFHATLDELDNDVAAPPAPLSSDTIRTLAINVAVLEIVRFLSGEPPTTLGGYVEISASTGLIHRTIHKAPACVGCGIAAGERYPFDAAPLVAEGL